MVDPIGVEFHPLAFWVVWCVGVGFVCFEFGQVCDEGVGVCSGWSGYVNSCNYYIYLNILICPCWQGLFQFS